MDFKTLKALRKHNIDDSATNSKDLHSLPETAEFLCFKQVVVMAGLRPPDHPVLRKFSSGELDEERKQELIMEKKGSLLQNTCYRERWTNKRTGNNGKEKLKTTVM